MREGVVGVGGVRWGGGGGAGALWEGEMYEYSDEERESVYLCDII